ncbi:MAG: hypothetical protein IKQ62_08365 [Bacteroidaceae bacterium]|nr:hypothetical protein [Bacteroidaceae bacterium]
MRKIVLILSMMGWVALMGQNPIEISDAAGLRAIKENLNGSYKLVADIDLGGKVTPALAEGESYETWTPLGNNPSSDSDVGSFNGIFDGNNHKITNLRVDVQDATTTYIGLFGRIGERGIVKNLTIESAVLRVASTEDQTRNMGSIAGVNHGIIANCTSNAEVKCYASSTDGGGIVGENRGDVVDCVFTGQVLTSQKEGGGDSYNSVFIGGIVGDNERGGTLLKCLSSGTITSSDHSGNLYGQNNGTVLCKGPSGVIDRTLYKDGSWNSLCLPFNMTISGSVLEGATVMELDISTEGYTHPTGIEGTVLYLNFKEVDAIEAGMPYIIKWAESENNLVNPTFSYEAIATTNPTGITSHDGNVTFIGTLSTKKVGAEGDDSFLYLGKENKLYCPSESMEIGVLRAYFQLNNGYVAGEPEEGGAGNVGAGGAAQRVLISEFRLNFSDEATAIHNLGTDKSSRTGQFYDLSGRRVSADRLEKGIYIKDGKRIFVGK